MDEGSFDSKTFHHPFAPLSAAQKKEMLHQEDEEVESGLEQFAFPGVTKDSSAGDLNWSYGLANHGDGLNNLLEAADSEAPTNMGQNGGNLTARRLRSRLPSTSEPPADVEVLEKRGSLVITADTLFGFDQQTEAPYTFRRSRSWLGNADEKGKETDEVKSWREVYPGVWLPEKQTSDKKIDGPVQLNPMDGTPLDMQKGVVDAIFEQVEEKLPEQMVEIYPGVFVPQPAEGKQEEVVQSLIDECAAAENEVFPGVKLPSLEEPEEEVVSPNPTKKKKKKVGWRDLGPRKMVEIFPSVWLPVGENEKCARDIVQDVLFFEKGSAAAELWGVCKDVGIEEAKKRKRRAVIRKVMEGGLLA